MKIKIYSRLFLLMSLLGVTWASSAMALHNIILSDEPERALDALANVDLDEIVNGKAPIHLAVEKGLDALVVKLIDGGANLNLPTSDGVFPADIAFKRNNLKLYDLLTKSGARRGHWALEKKRHKIKLFDLLHSDEARLLFPHMYPLFMSDAEAFQLLRKGKQTSAMASWQIAEILGSMVVEGFPNGLPSIEARKELERLLYDIDASPLLRERICDVLSQYFCSLPLGNIAEPNTERALWQERQRMFMRLDVVALAKSMCALENKQLRKITPSQISLWLTNEKFSEAITEYSETCNRSIIFWGFVIVNGTDQGERNNNAEKIVQLGCQFRKLGNFSGVQSVVAALSNPMSQKMVTLSKKGQQKLDRLAKIINPNGNHRAYRKAIKRFDNKPCIPLLGVLLHDIKAYCEGEDDIMNRKGLLTLAELCKCVDACTKLSCCFAPFDNPAVTDFLCKPMDISDDVNDALCFAERPDLFSFHINFSSKQSTIRNCSASGLVKCMAQLSMPNSVTLCLFRAEIWSGIALESSLAQASNKDEQLDVLVKLGLTREQAITLRYNFALGCIFDI